MEKNNLEGYQVSTVSKSLTIYTYLFPEKETLGIDDWEEGCHISWVFVICFGCPIRFAVSANEFICLGPIQHTFRIVCGLHCCLLSSSGPALPLKLHLFLQYLILSSWSCFRQTFQMTKSSFCLAYSWFCLEKSAFLDDYFPVLVWQNHHVCLTKYFFLDIWMTPYVGNSNPIWLIFFRGVGIPPTRNTSVASLRGMNVVSDSLREPPRFKPAPPRFPPATESQRYPGGEENCFSGENMGS